jgi:uncharacterized protein YdaU (DUF1376 family)
VAEFPALPFFTDVYLADTIHLSTEEHGAYLLLLMTAWRTRGCYLPNDNKMLARITRTTPAKWRKLRPVMADFFHIEGDRWVQKRLVKTYGDVEKRVAKNRINGAKGGRVSAAKAAKRLVGDKTSKPLENNAVDAANAPLLPKQKAGPVCGQNEWQDKGQASDRNLYEQGSNGASEGQATKTKTKLKQESESNRQPAGMILEKPAGIIFERIGGERRIEETGFQNPVALSSGFSNGDFLNPSSLNLGSANSTSQNSELQGCAIGHSGMQDTSFLASVECIPNSQESNDQRNTGSKRTNQNLHNQGGGIWADALVPIAAAAGLIEKDLNVSVIARWFEGGADLDKDILPTIQRLAARQKTKLGKVPSHLGYYSDAILEARAQRLGQPRTSDLTGQSQGPGKNMNAWCADRITDAVSDHISRPAGPDKRAFNPMSLDDWREFLGDGKSRFRGDYLSKNWFIDEGHPTFHAFDLGADPKRASNPIIPDVIYREYGPTWLWLGWQTAGWNTTEEQGQKTSGNKL